MPRLRKKCVLLQQTTDVMKKLLILFTLIAALAACQESIEERAERDAREATAKRCPMRMNNEGTLILERIHFDRSTRTWKQDFLLDSLFDVDYREILLGELKNTPSYQPYMDNGFNFLYVFLRMSNPKDTLISILLTPKDYAKR